MKILFLLIPVLLGVIGLLQGGLNKEIGHIIGVAQATLVGMVITLLIAIVFFYAVKFSPEFFAPIYHIKAPIFTWRWYFIIPGILGFLIVSLLPWAFLELGAVKATILIVAAQMIFSVFWDISVEKLPINSSKIIGMVFVFIGTLFIVVKK
jgi:transporter family-2 protein